MFIPSFGSPGLPSAVWGQLRGTCLCSWFIQVWADGGRMDGVGAAKGTLTKAVSCLRLPLTRMKFWLIVLYSWEWDIEVLSVPENVTSVPQRIYLSQCYWWRISRSGLGVTQVPSQRGSCGIERLGIQWRQGGVRLPPPQQRADSGALSATLFPLATLRPSFTLPWAHLPHGSLAGSLLLSVTLHMVWLGGMRGSYQWCVFQEPDPCRPVWPPTFLLSGGVSFPGLIGRPYIFGYLWPVRHFSGPVNFKGDVARDQNFKFFAYFLLWENPRGLLVCNRWTALLSSGCPSRKPLSFHQVFPSSRWQLCVIIAWLFVDPPHNPTHTHTHTHARAPWGRLGLDHCGVPRPWQSAATQQVLHKWVWNEKQISTAQSQGWASRMAQAVKNLPAVRETWVQPLSWEDRLEKGTATHSSILAWRIPWTVKPMGLQRIRHKWVAFTKSGVVLTAAAPG